MAQGMGHFFYHQRFHDEFSDTDLFNLLFGYTFTESGADDNLHGGSDL